MAILAIVRRLEMAGILPFLNCSIMTTETICGDAIMVEVGRGPRIRRMANFAIVSGRNVIRILACGG